MATKTPAAFSSRSKHPCPECGSELPTAAKRGKARTFCTENCKQTHNNRMASRGKALSKIALGWRHSRGSGDLGKYLFQEMTSMLDQWNAEDAATRVVESKDGKKKTVPGRMRADHYAGLVVDFTGSANQPPLRYQDRK